jgi:hypothetical protein
MLSYMTVLGDAAVVTREIPVTGGAILYTYLFTS